MKWHWIGYPIPGLIIVHHIIPITIEDIINENPLVFDINNLVSVSDHMHKLIHYANSLDGLKIYNFEERKPNDTKLW